MKKCQFKNIIIIYNNDKDPTILKFILKCVIIYYFKFKEKIIPRFHIDSTFRYFNPSLFIKIFL